MALIDAVAEGALHLPAVRETFMSQTVAVVDVAAGAVIDLATVADLPRLDDLAHPFDAAAALHLRVSPGAHLDAAAVPRHLTDLDLPFAALVARPPGLRCAAIEPGAVRGRFRQAMTAEGCAGHALDLRLQGINQAHHHSDCRVRAPEARRAVDALNLGHPIHGLSPHNLSE